MSKGVCVKADGGRNGTGRGGMWKCLGGEEWAGGRMRKEGLDLGGTQDLMPISSHLLQCKITKFI